MTAEPAKVLCDIREVITSRAPQSGGALWRLAESGRQLDANLVHLPPLHQIDNHTEPDLDVLLIVVDGSGMLAAAGTLTSLTTGMVAWLPHGSSRSLAAGDRGLSYLTVHRRRPGMQIRRSAPST